MLAKVIIENGVKKLVALTADTGVGAPVGSIIVVCSNILPSGYLGLGVQYDITTYPALYQVLGTDTTPTASALGLPTLSSGQYAIKATSGLTENQQENVLNTINENLSYSTEEHPTGKKWIDGKPIYRKVVEYTLAQSTGGSYDSAGAFSLVGIDNIITAIAFNNYGVGTKASTRVSFNNGDILIEKSVTGAACSGYAIVEYTKTTD